MDVGGKNRWGSSGINTVAVIVSVGQHLVRPSSRGIELWTCLAVDSRSKHWRARKERHCYALEGGLKSKSERDGHAQSRQGVESGETTAQHIGYAALTRDHEWAQRTASKAGPECIARRTLKNQWVAGGRTVGLV
jgi:hypothetical protein